MQVGADREAMRVDLYVVTILGHPQIGIGVDGHLVQGLPERLAIVRVYLRTAPDRAAQGAIDRHQELAVGKRERLKWACRLDSHPISMWRGAKSLRRRGF